MVRSMATAPLEQTGTGYAGVALIDNEHDALLARAEPPTHDDWIAEQLPTPEEQRTVRQLLRNIERAAEKFVEPLEAAPLSGTDGASVVELATHLGELLMSTTGTERTSKPVRTAKAVIEDASPRPPKPMAESGPTVGGASTPTAEPGPEQGAARIRPVGQPRLRLLDPVLVEHEGQGAVRLPFEVKRGVRAVGIQVTAEALVCLDEGQVEENPPVGAEVPTLLGWLDEAGSMISTGVEPLVLRGVERWAGAALVRLVDDAWVKPRLAATSIEPPPEVPS